MAFRDTFLNMLGVETQEVQKTDNSVFKSARDFLRNGSRERLYPTWSDIKMSDSDMYRGYSYAVIQKRGNKVASLAKNNLKTWAKPEVVDEFQKKGETPFHPYLKLIEDSTKFTEKQFWKNISIYLDLAGRYYLGVIRNEVKPLNPKLPTITTDPTEFIMLNPYEIRRVVDKNGQVAGYIERKSDGRYREWPLHQIIEIRELNPFDPDNSQWAMTDAAKNAVYTINQSGDYTRQSLNGNIDAPGIITTDVLLTDEDFANFKARITQHTKGEPLFGNGTGAINWDSMQIDLDKAALLDINEINRTELFAVSGTSKTSLGIEQSGTTRETARVQSEQFVSDTAQPRLEDIVDFLNLDYKKHYKREYDKTGYKIEVESAVGKDYDTEQKATALKQSQFQLAMQLVQSGYTTETAYQFAEGEIDFADLELEKGLDKPKNPEQPEDPDENASNPQNKPPRNDSGGGQDKSSVDENKGTENANNGLDLDLEPHSDLVANGGKGSGNFGHVGRPGEIGGSGSGKTQLQRATEAEATSGKVGHFAGLEYVDEIYKEKSKKIKDDLTRLKEVKDRDGFVDANDPAHARLDKLKEQIARAKELVGSDVPEAQRTKIEKLEKLVGKIEDITGWKNSIGRTFNGGKGSGNFGHAGREGEVGGSAPAGTITAKVDGPDDEYVVLEETTGTWKDKIKTHSRTYSYGGDKFKAVTAEYVPYPDVLLIDGEGRDSNTREKIDMLGFLDNYPKDTDVAKALWSGRLKSLDRLADGDKDEWETIKAHLSKMNVRKEDGKRKNSVEGEKCDPLEVLEVDDHCTCEHDHKVETFINEVNQDDGKVVEKAYKDFLQEVRDIEKETIDASVKKVEVNAFEISDIIGPRKRKTLTEKLKNALHKYWWLIFPLFANNSMSKRNEEFGKDIGFVFNNELQAGVDDNAQRVAEGHMETILNDILGASNRAYTNILEEAAAEIIIKAYKVDPEKFSDYFKYEPTMADALSSIRKTDILEENRKIYEKANKMAFEGYNRRDIIKAIRDEYSHISEQRATLIARNETSRAFTRSQFEADKQFLNGVGKLGQAYKVWYSRRPANEQDKICDFCNEMIRTSEENPVPFEEPFIKYGDSMEVVGNDGKLKIFTANYEDIEGGCLHPNCMCGYHLVFKNASGEFIKTLNGGVGSGNFGHAGRPGEVGGSSDGKGGLDLWKERVKKIDNVEELLDLQESIVDENVTNYLKKLSEDMTDEEKNAVKDFYDKTSVIRERLFELEEADLKYADHLISEWVSGTLDWENRKIDFDPIDIELSKSTARGLLENDKNLTAYRVQVTDEMLPSEGAGYSLSKGFSDPSVPHKFVQRVTEDNVILTPNIVEAGYGYGGSPNWQHEIILKNDERLKAINNGVVLNGGKGSGNFGHKGRPGEVGGSGDGKLSFAKLRKLTNWTDNEWAYASGYFASFNRTTAVNNYLETGEDKLIEGSDGEIMASDCARELQRKIENTEFPEDGVLYRGIAVKKDKFFELVENGFQVTGFQSTSVDKKKAEDILNMYQDRWLKRRGMGEDAYLHLVLKINVKKGQKFAASLHDSEKEVVLPNKSKFKVADTKENKSLIDFMKEAPRAAGSMIEELEVDYE